MTILQVLAENPRTGRAAWPRGNGGEVHLELREVGLVDVHHPGAVHDHGIQPRGVAVRRAHAATQEVGRQAALVVHVHQHLEGLHALRTVDVPLGGGDVVVHHFPAHGVEDRRWRPEVGAAHGVAVLLLALAQRTGHLLEFLQRRRRPLDARFLEELLVPQQHLRVGVLGQPVVVPLPEVGGQRAGEGLGGDLVEVRHGLVQWYQGLQFLGELRHPDDVQSGRVRPFPTGQAGQQGRLEVVVGVAGHFDLDAGMPGLEQGDDFFHRLHLGIAHRVPVGHRCRCRCFRGQRSFRRRLLWQCRRDRGGHTAHAGHHRQAQDQQAAQKNRDPLSALHLCSVLLTSMLVVADHQTDANGW